MNQKATYIDTVTLDKPRRKLPLEKFPAYYHEALADYKRWLADAEQWRQWVRDRRTSRGKNFDMFFEEIKDRRGQRHNLKTPSFFSGHEPYAIALSWFVDGKMHRVDGPANVDCFDMMTWYQRGKYGRPPGQSHLPTTILADGSCHFGAGDDMLHRLDGPAIIYPNGSCCWAIDGSTITQQVIEWRKANKIAPWYEWTNSEITLFNFEFRG